MASEACSHTRRWRSCMRTALTARRVALSRVRLAFMLIRPWHEGILSHKSLLSHARSVITRRHALAATQCAHFTQCVCVRSRFRTAVHSHTRSPWFCSLPLRCRPSLSLSINFTTHLFIKLSVDLPFGFSRLLVSRRATANGEPEPLRRPSKQHSHVRHFHYVQQQREKEREKKPLIVVAVVAFAVAPFLLLFGHSLSKKMIKYSFASFVLTLTSAAAGRAGEKRRSLCPSPFPSPPVLGQSSACWVRVTQILISVNNLPEGYSRGDSVAKGEG